MLLTEYNEAEAMELFREDGRAEGKAEGIAEGIVEGRVEACAENVAGIMANLGMTVEQALDAIGIAPEERAQVLALLAERDIRAE